MQTTKIVVLMICCSLLLVSCDDDDASSQVGTSVEASSVLGSWRVAHYSDGSGEETSSFSDITFGFREENVFLVFRNGEELLAGTWTLRDQGRELDIAVPVLAGDNEAFGEDLYEISDDWDIILSSETELHLVDAEERFELVKIPSQ